MSVRAARFIALFTMLRVDSFERHGQSDVDAVQDLAGGMPHAGGSPAADA